MDITTFVDFKAPVIALAAQAYAPGDETAARGAMVLAGGGGGTSKTGVLNYVNLYEVGSQMSGLAALKAKHSFAQDDMVTSLAISRDSRLVAMGVAETPECTVLAFDAKKKQMTKLTSFVTDFTEEDPCQNSVAFSPKDAATVATGGADGTLRVWKLKLERVTGAKGKAKSKGGKAKAGGEAESKGASTDEAKDDTKGSAAKSKSGAEDESKDTPPPAVTGAAVKVFKKFEGHAKAINHVEFHPSGEWVLTASNDDTLRLWAVSGAKKVFTLSGFGEAAQGSASGLKQRRRKHGSWRYRTACFSADGSSIFALESSLRGPAVVSRFDEPDGGWAKAGHGSLKPARTRNVHNEPVSALALGPNGKFLAVGGGDGAVMVCTTDSLARVQKVPVHGLAVTSLCFHEHENGLCVISGSAARSLAITRVRPSSASFAKMVAVVVLLVAAAGLVYWRFMQQRGAAEETEL